MAWINSWRAALVRRFEGTGIQGQYITIAELSLPGAGKTIRRYSIIGSAQVTAQGDSEKNFGGNSGPGTRTRFCTWICQRTIHQDFRSSARWTTCGAASGSPGFFPFVQGSPHSGVFSHTGIPRCGCNLAWRYLYECYTSRYLERYWP